MGNNTRNVKIATSIFYAAASVAVFIAVVTIFGEFYPPLKNWLKAVFSHHWIGKGVLSAALFVVLSVVFLLKTRSDNSLLRSAKTAFWFSIASSLAILIFYCYEVILAH